MKMPRKKRGRKSKTKSEKPKIKYLRESEDLFGFHTIEEKEKEAKGKERLEKLQRFQSKILIPKSMKTTKTRGRSPRVSAQSGIRGFWR